MMTPDPTLIFLHVPKAAGSTLHGVISRQFVRGLIYTCEVARPEKVIANFRQRHGPTEERIQMFSGHMQFGLHEYISRPCSYLAILRDPIERAISHYHYFLRMPKLRLHQKVEGKEISFQEYVSGGITREMDNGQTRILAGAKGVPFGGSAQEMLERAKANMQKHFALVGLTERFDQMLILLRYILGWRNLYYYKANVTRNRPRREDFPAETIRIIEEHNQLDLALYAHAQKVFDHKAAQLDSFESELQTFQARNRRFGWILSRTLSLWMRGRSLAYSLSSGSGRGAASEKGVN